MQTIRVVSLFLAVVSSFLSLHAATFIVPSDESLIAAADDIVVGTAVTSLVERNDRGAIVTRYTLRIEEVLKGDRAAGSYLVLTERGGHLGDSAKYIPGTPQYVAGQRYLVFTDASTDDITTLVMALGQFRIVDDGQRRLAVRSEVFGFDQNLEPHRELVRDASAFATHIRGVLSRSVGPSTAYFVDEPADRFEAASHWTPQVDAGRGIYLLSDGGSFYRWSPPTATMVRNGSQPGVDGPASVTKAFQQWNSTDSNIDYDDGGVDNSATGGLDVDDGKNAVLFNTALQPPFSSAAAIGGITDSTGPSTFEGESFWKIKEVDVVVNNITISSQNCLNSVMTHEVGHTLGFKHAAESPNHADAIMNWQVQCGWNGVLKQYDKDAAAVVYGNGCSLPGITTHPQTKTIFAGATTSLSVTATGTAVTYQWYIGTAPDTSTPTGTNSSTLSNLSPSSTTSYWVRVTNACGSVNSNTATVTVQACNPPSITAQPQPKSTTYGTAANMSVEVTGTGPLTYQWYVGNTGDTSDPIAGARSATPSIALVATARVWVRINGQCSPPADSQAVTITVTCPDVVVGTPTATGFGANWTLNVTASTTSTGPLKYEWFRGSNPGSSVAPKVGEGQSLPVVVTGVTQFWAKVTNACGVSKASDLVVVAPCQLPVITTQPADRTIVKNTSTQLAVVATGDGVTIQWYQGIAPDKTILLGSGASIDVAPLTSTSYWASLTNTCGEISTRTVLVSVSEPTCNAPAITTQPTPAQEVKGGSTVTLTVVAEGTATLHYQWYEGLSGDATSPVGTDSATFTTPVLGLSASYWVKITNGCGEASSATAQITVPKGRRRSTRH
ncbi:MAG TPA: matrixin family metalloprotease [Thermoanaerobaculia bacterium]